MARIDEIRILPGVWVAFTVNDYGQYGKPRLGFGRRHANLRVAKRIV